MNDKPNDTNASQTYSDSNLSAVNSQRKPATLCRFQSVYSEDCLDALANDKKKAATNTNAMTLTKEDPRLNLQTYKKKHITVFETFEEPSKKPPAVVNHVRPLKYENYRSFQTPFVRAGINIFNGDANDGIAFLIAIDCLQPNSSSVAEFFKNVHFLSKDKVGEVLGSISIPFCLDALNQFVDRFDFTSMYPDEALRNFQNFFRMPGEAQKIHAILDKFAERYLFCNQNSNLTKANNIQESEAILVLVYAIVMLNTDLHNPSVKWKMSLDQFLKNMEGVDSCKDVPKTFLKDIYTNISKSEFSVGFDHMKQLKEMSSLISGKGLPQIVQAQRQFIGIRDVTEIRSIKYTERCCMRSLFIFNDLVIFTRTVNSKSIRHRFSLTINKNSFYFYVKSINLKYIQPVMIESKSTPFNVLLVSHTGECVAILDCVDSKNREKVFTDFKQFCYEAYLTDFITQAIPQKFFKSITTLIETNENILTHEIVTDFKSKINEMQYPVVKVDPANVVFNPEHRF